MSLRACVTAIFLLFFTSCALASEKAILLDINSAIGPATIDYVKRGIAYAQKEKAELIILQLNTPGGLETAMRSINQAIIASSVPVVTYVAPSGARAASAGTFILYASHLAAMAHGTNVGAATPVGLMHSSPGGKKELTSEEKKAINDAVAYLQSLAELRHRNIEWAQEAVRNAASISAEKAKKLNVINFIAKDISELLQKSDKQVVNINGAEKKIDTKNTVQEIFATDWRYEFLSFITNPNIAYLLMLLAMYGLFFELSNPGLILPGVAGVIALVLALYAFQLMPVNYVGLSLILIGITFLILELFVTSYGVVGLGGVIAFIIGSIMLFDVNDPNYQVMLSLIITMSVISLLFFFTLLMLAINSHKRAVITGKEGLIGSEGVVLNQMNEQIVVRVLGEIWEARANEMLNTGQKIKVTGINGLILHVEPLDKISS